LNLLETNAAAQLIEERVSEDATVIFGASIDESLEDEIRITVIATGLDGEFAGEKKEEKSEEDNFFTNLMKAEEETIDVPNFLK
ncbi:MAG: cell division protein FtsZ, partial [Clostridia bacterium]|nr:cell division protein FtsZ [Clostridia bacterium]